MEDFISIILCSYNSENLIEETLESIRNQTYKKFELIIVDDGSSDNTVIKIQNFAKLNKKMNIKLITQQNKGLAYARNKAIKHSSFNLIAMIDHDDIWDPSKLSEQIQDIKNNNDCHLFCSDFEIFNSSKKKYSRFDLARDKENYNPAKINMNKNKSFSNLLLNGCFIGSSTVIFKKSIINDVGFFDNRYKFLTDYIFFLNVGKKYNIYCSNKVLSKWRDHDSQSTKKLHLIYFKEMNKLYFKTYIINILNIFQKMVIFKKHIRLNIVFILKYLKFL